MRDERIMAAFRQDVSTRQLINRRVKLSFLCYQIFRSATSGVRELLLPSAVRRDVGLAQIVRPIIKASPAGQPVARTVMSYSRWPGARPPAVLTAPR